MAGSVVSFLLQKLPQLLVDEANYLKGARKEVDSFQNQLNLINFFLEDSAKTRDKHKIKKEFIRQIRDLAFQGEHVIDSYIYNELKQMRRNKAERKIHLLTHKKNLHDIRKEIEEINSGIEEINNRKEKYVVEKTEKEARDEAREAWALHNRRKHVEEIDIVGFVHNSTTLVKQLTEGKLELDVSSILGMGGLGKTTLARKVYKDDRVKNHFDCRAWVHVSQDFRSEELLIEILKSPEMQISEYERELKDLTEVELKEKLTEYLRRKKYLVVMDDVWTTAVWDVVKGAFPDDSNGSRILLTSRDKKVLLHASCATPYLLPFLTADESWELLRKKVFQRQECPPELETLGRQIAKSCEGLPLSIVVLAGLLASKEKKEFIWEEFHRNLSWHLRQEKKKWEAILFLSYTQLRPELKPCFLYFGVYPEGPIPVRQLTQLWIAEGFIQDAERSSMEDVAENYLWELIDLCLIQVDQMRSTGEGVKTCRIHDLLRDLCISESTEEKFLKVSTDDDLSSKERTRRLSILRDTPEYISHHNPFNPSRARSLLFFGENTCRLKEKHWKWVFKYSKFVRVLNFGRAISHCIPDDIGKLMYLKYFRIESMHLDDIPSSICNLQYLETLDARGSELNCLPDGIWKLQCLRNLYLSGSSKSFPPPPPSPSELEVTLSNLQILSTVTVDPQILVKLPNLRKLGMKPELQSEEIFESLGHLHYLKTLKITNCSELPSGANSLPRTITKITLIRVHLKCMTVLGNLPKLRVLKLQHCSSDNLSFPADSFQVLEVLKLDELSITEWKLGRGAGPHLTHLVLKNCTSLTLARMLQELQMKMKVGVKVQIYPPQDDNHYKTFPGLHLESLHI